jgi:hypothetical protein
VVVVCCLPVVFREGIAMIQFCIDARQLRKALAAIEAAEQNGFMHCLAVLELKSCGFTVGDHRVIYSDLMEKAHNSDPRFDWGRFQYVTKYNRFVDGKLVPIEESEKPNA